MSIQLPQVQELLENHNIIAHQISEHSKASESYVEVIFHFDSNYEWKGLIPYFYRRGGLFIESEAELAEYLISIKHFFTKSTVISWIESEIQLWNTEFSKKIVTKPFFDALSTLRWTSDFPRNNNPQRRIQDIKDMGYTISTRRVGGNTERLLVPIPRGVQTGYETMSKNFKDRAMKTLKFLNIYELSKANRRGLIPDHKFPEIRWDAETRTENHEDMDNGEVKNKFQLLDNQRNLQKREVCRNCFQTGKRGILFGVNFFYEGNEEWALNIPKVGKAAEEGCIGCGWYDIEKWRDELNLLIKQ